MEELMKKREDEEDSLGWCFLDKNDIRPYFDWCKLLIMRHVKMI